MNGINRPIDTISENTATILEAHPEGFGAG
jgi:hypothetical protein